MNKVRSQTTCCSLENPITDCRGTLGNTPPGNLSPSARIRDRTSSSLSTSSAHSVSLSFTLTDFLSLLWSSLPFICLCFSSASSITLVFTLSCCLVWPILSSCTALSVAMHKHVLGPLFIPVTPALPLTKSMGSTVHWPPSLGEEAAPNAIKWNTWKFYIFKNTNKKPPKQFNMKKIL